MCLGSIVLDSAICLVRFTRVFARGYRPVDCACN